jgi:hypothetical protein
MSLIDAYTPTAQSITITPKGTKQADGRYLYDGTQVSTMAWLTRKTGVVRSVAGNEYTYQYEVLLNTDSVIALDDRITYNGVDFQVRSIDTPQHLDGTAAHHRLKIG